MKLAVLKGPKEEDNVTVSRVPYAIGRCRSADFIIAHVNVSRNHCKIVKENGLWTICDFSSSGTYINDTLIGQGKSLTLNDGDRVRFGPPESNLSWCFYTCDTTSTDTSLSLKTQTDYNEICSKGKYCSGKMRNVNGICGENELYGGSKGIAKCFDLKLKTQNEKLPVKEEREQTSQIKNESVPSIEYSHSVEQKNVQESENEKIKELTNELQQVRKTLTILEEKNCAVQRESVMEVNSKKLPLTDTNLLENLADLLETEFQCTICSELFVTAVTLSCTHTFCKFCINQWKKKQKTCPICRKKITNETRSLVVDNYIDKMVGNLSLELKDRREAIIKERNGPEPKKKRSKQRN